MMEKFYNQTKNRTEPTSIVILGTDKYGKIQIEETTHGKFVAVKGYKGANTLASCRGDILCFGRCILHLYPYSME